MREARVDPKRVQPLPNWGVELVEHLCPVCGVSTRLPLTNLAAGSLGDWSCESCNRIFRIRVSMEQLNLSVVPPPAASDTAPKANAMQPEDRLLTLYGEELHLRSRLEDLREEVARLEKALAR